MKIGCPIRSCWQLETINQCIQQSIYQRRITVRICWNAIAESKKTKHCKQSREFTYIFVSVGFCYAVTVSTRLNNLLFQISAQTWSETFDTRKITYLKISKKHFGIKEYAFHYTRDIVQLLDWDSEIRLRSSIRNCMHFHILNLHCVVIQINRLLEM